MNQVEIARIRDDVRELGSHWEPPTARELLEIITRLVDAWDIFGEG